MDLISVVLHLRWLATATPATRPLWWGRAAHALLLRAMADEDASMATTLHEGDGPRPFTASTLMGRFRDRLPDREEVYTLRLTGLQADVAAALARAATGGSLAAGAEVELDGHRFAVSAATAEEDVWSGRTTYAALAASGLMQETPPRRLTLQLTSPTTFKSAGRHVPIPLPGLVAGSLLQRWNSFAGVAFPPEAQRYADECLAVAQYRLATRPVPMKEGGLRVGAIGQITFTSLNYDRYWMGVMQALAAFARFGGVGAGTTAGLGQCRLLEDD